MGNIRKASRRKYHFIYRTTCLTTGRWYIGLHSSDNLDDGYLGSGQRISRSIKKHGKQNHRREIVEFCQDRLILKAREAEIVTEDMLKDPLCMNLIVGGSASEGHELLTCQKISNSHKGKKISPDYLQKLNDGWRGQKHSDETCQKMKESIAIRSPEVKAEIMQRHWDARRINGTDSHSDETKQLISKKQSGKQYSEESKLKKAESMRCHWATVTDEQRQAFKQKVSTTKRARQVTMSHMTVESISDGE